MHVPDYHDAQRLPAGGVNYVELPDGAVLPYALESYQQEDVIDAHWEVGREREGQVGVPARQLNGPV